MFEYEIRNRVIDGYLLLLDKSWEELDRLNINIVNAIKQRIVSEGIYIEGDIS